jgi:hypothetical protein
MILVGTCGNRVASYDPFIDYCLRGSWNLVGDILGMKRFLQAFEMSQSSQWRGITSFRGNWWWKHLIIYLYLFIYSFFIYLFSFLLIYLSIYLFSFLLIYLSIYLFSCLLIYLSIYLVIYWFIYSITKVLSVSRI